MGTTKESEKTAGFLTERNEELEDMLAAAHEVNAHLAQRVESLTLENDSLHAHIRRLTKLLKPPDENMGKREKEEPWEERATDEDSQYEASAKIGKEGWQTLSRQARAQGWLLDSKYVTLGSVIGRGTFGTTYKGFWQGIDVAVKAVSPSPDSLEAFVRESTTLALIRHANVVQLYGAVCEPSSEKCWLVCELLTGDSLAKWVHSNSQGRRTPRRTFLERLRAILHVACGMQALEQMEPYSCIHRDLKPSNVLWNGSDRWKVSDMGLSRILDPDAIVSLTPETGSYLYMAPEVIRHDSYATQADVWSWACLATEIISSSRPYTELHLTPIQAALQVAEGNLHPRIPSECPEKLSGLLTAAFAPDPLDRPSFAVIAAMMRKIVAEEEERQQSEGTGTWRWFSR